MAQTKPETCKPRPKKPLLQVAIQKSGSELSTACKFRSAVHDPDSTSVYVHEKHLESARHARRYIGKSTFLMHFAIQKFGNEFSPGRLPALEWGSVGSVREGKEWLHGYQYSLTLLAKEPETRKWMLCSNISHCNLDFNSWLQYLFVADLLNF